MISKEERAELRKKLSDASHSFPLPWRTGDYEEVIDANGHEVAECVERHHTGDSAERCIAAAVNAAPHLLDALDAADERIAELEAEAKHWRLRFEAARARIGLRDGDIVDLETEVASLQKRIAELEAAAQSAIFAIQPTWAIFAIQPTWAQDPASSPATLGRAIAAHQESLQALANGCDYVASQTDGYDRLVADPMVALGLLAVVETDEDGDTTYKRVRPAPICDIELGVLVPIARGEDGPEGPVLAHVAELDRAVQVKIAEAFGALLSRLLASSQQEHLATFAPPKQVWVKKRLLREANESRQRGLRAFASILHTSMGGRIPDEVPHV